MKPNAQFIDSFVKGIVETAKPRKVILFGSASRGDMRPDSDYDFLVVVPDGARTGELERSLFGRWWGLPVAKDFVVITESQLAQHGANPYYVYKSALDEGTVLYAA